VPPAPIEEIDITDGLDSGYLSEEEAKESKVACSGQQNISASISEKSDDSPVESRAHEGATVSRLHR
jgi:hypothetical protein